MYNQKQIANTVNAYCTLQSKRDRNGKKYTYKAIKESISEGENLSKSGIEKILLGREKKTKKLDDSQKTRLLELYNTHKDYSVRTISENSKNFLGKKISQGHIYNVLWEMNNREDISRGVDWRNKKGQSCPLAIYKKTIEDQLKESLGKFPFYDARTIKSYHKQKPTAILMPYKCEGNALQLRESASMVVHKKALKHKVRKTFELFGKAHLYETVRLSASGEVQEPVHYASDIKNIKQETLASKLKSQEETLPEVMFTTSTPNKPSGILKTAAVILIGIGITYIAYSILNHGQQLANAKTIDQKITYNIQKIDHSSDISYNKEEEDISALTSSDNWINSIREIPGKDITAPNTEEYLDNVLLEIKNPSFRSDIRPANQTKPVYGLTKKIISFAKEKYGVLKKTASRIKEYDIESTHTKKHLGLDNNLVVAVLDSSIATIPEEENLESLAELADQWLTDDLIEDIPYSKEKVDENKLNILESLLTTYNLREAELFVREMGWKLDKSQIHGPERYTHIAYTDKLDQIYFSEEKTKRKQEIMLETHRAYFDSIEENTIEELRLRLKMRGIAEERIDKELENRTRDARKAFLLTLFDHLKNI